MKESFTESTEFTELVPGLPEELALECLTRLEYTAHRVGSQVCRRWRELLEDQDFYYHRKQAGQTRKVACLVQLLPVQSKPGTEKRVGHPSYCISFFDPGTGDWGRVDPIPKYPNGFPLFCQVVGSEGKLVVMGGWDPVSWEPVKDVFVYEFTTRNWTQRKDMPSTRSFFALGESAGKIFIAGGHDDSKNALSSAWVYNLKEDEWTELPPMNEERDECEGVVIGSEFWVVSGYETESQGRFKTSSEVYDIGSGKWKRGEDTWKGSQCPRSCVGVGPNGKLMCWAGSESEFRVGVCGVELGDGTTLVTGSPYQGGSQLFFLKEGQNGKLVKFDVPVEFSGFVQSGCCVEI